MALNIVLLLIIVPLGIYLTRQTYRSKYGTSTIGRDIRRALQSFREIIQKVTNQKSK